MSRQQNIYNKLAKFRKAQDKPKRALSKCKYNFSKKRINLKKRNVKLSLIDELTQEYEYVEEAVSIASYYGYERLEELTDKYYDFQSEIGIEVDNMAINSSVRYVEEGTEKLLEMLSKVENLATELGTEPSELYDNYDEVKQLANNAMEVYSDFKDAYKEFIRETGLVKDFIN